MSLEPGGSNPQNPKKTRSDERSDDPMGFEL